MTAARLPSNFPSCAPAVRNPRARLPPAPLFAAPAASRMCPHGYYCRRFQMPPGMNWSEIRLRNVGPIERGTIANSKVCVFLGPNNSGKSFASRIIYGLRQLNEDALAPGAAARSRRGARDAQIADSPFAPLLIARNAGIDVGGIATRGRPGGWIEVAGGGTSARFSFDGASGPERRRLALRAAGTHIGASRDIVYIPAERTGAMRSLPPLARAKSGLLGASRESQGEGHAEARDSPPRSPRADLPCHSGMPAYLARFNDLVLEAASDGLADDARKMLAEVFDGPGEGGDTCAPSRAHCLGARGFAAWIDSAGSGAVSSFPMAAAVCGAGRGGTVIVEEPEAHLEPLTQMKMVARLARAADARDVGLVLTTHSEYVAYALLSMVSHGELESGDLGLYYFRRGPDMCTRIEKVDVTKDGMLDVDLFEDALDALGTRM